MKNYNVIVVGAGGGGAVVAKELGELGLKVLMTEAGPWYGNSKWPCPNTDKGADSSQHVDDLNIALFKQSYTKLENDMNDLITGKLRWGPANRERPPWTRVFEQSGFVWQNSGVGGSTQHYLANSPRAFPTMVDGEWPISYRELLPFYEKVEAELPVEFAPVTAKEELFYFGAKRAGWSLLSTLDVNSSGYRPQPNAILSPNPNLTNTNYSTYELSWMEGCTLAGHCINGCPHGPSVEKIAKRSTNVSYTPLALATGNVEIMPNTFTYKIITEDHPKEGIRATGVKVRNTWTDLEQEFYADCIVIAAGAIETPRLWLNSQLPFNEWVGKGLSNHNMDLVTGIFNSKELVSIINSSNVGPNVGHTSGARFDYPGLGSLLAMGLSPGLTASFAYGLSKAGNSPYLLNQTFSKGRIIGKGLMELMANYQNTMNLLIVTHDEIVKSNKVSITPTVKDEHGPVPAISYVATKKTLRRKKKLIKIASDILVSAGAKRVVHSDWPDGIMIHVMSTMRMGYVVDQNCEAFQVKRLFIADNSVLVNGLGGPNPTLTTQALATRTAKIINDKYF
ncbi:GMC family oxidoreductase [Cytobacillus suaedae]|nr:GMC family oxidoreductase [Cytobacillus suaedae]